MKNLTAILGITVFSLSLFACSQKEDNAPIEVPQDNIVTASCEIEIDDVDASSPSKVVAANGSPWGTYKPKVYLTYDLNREKVVSWMTEDKVYDIIYERKGYTRAEVDAAINQELQRAPFDGSPLTKCIEDCKDKYTNADGTKKPGRGDCKFWCVINWLGDKLVLLVSHNMGVVYDKPMLPII